MTNATKALLIALANATLQLIAAFGIELSDAQTAAITGFVNAILALWVGLTYKNSPTRTPDETG